MTDNYISDFVVTESTIHRIPENKKYCRIPRSICEIGPLAFSNCILLTYLYIPDTVGYIDRSAFQGCKALVSVRLPSKLHILESHLFYDCYSLKNVIMPVSLDLVSHAVFENCESLESICIPDSVADVASSIFRGCSSLHSISISWNLIRVELGVFLRNNSVRNFYRRYKSDVYGMPGGFSTIGHSALCFQYPRVTFHNVNMCALQMFETALMGVLWVLDTNEVDDSVNIAMDIVYDHFHYGFL